MTKLSEIMKQCYEARELPTWSEILNAADELDRLSRQLAEAQRELAEWKRGNRLHVAAENVANERRREAERQLAEVLEDRACFPDKPDGIGRMIEAHIGNLKTAKDAADAHAGCSVTVNSQMSRKMKPKRARVQEPEEAIGTMMCQIDCPSCGNVFDLEGDRDGEMVECPDCKTKLKIRRM